MDKETCNIKHHRQEVLIIGIPLWDRCGRRGYHGDGKTLENVHNHQINPSSSALLPFEGTNLIRLVLHIKKISFRMKLIVELEHFHHEALNSKRREISSQERSSYPSIPWGRPYAAYNMHQWTGGIQKRRTREHAKPPLQSP
jgi:hypothetical protein